jgi:hypothetical protein
MPKEDTSTLRKAYRWVMSIDKDEEAKKKKKKRGLDKENLPQSAQLRALGY